MRCFTVLGPSGSGKSVLVDALAALEGSSQKAETRSGLSVTTFGFGGEPWCAIDCPGSIESLPDARYALLASDAAVLCVSPDPEEAVLAAPFMRAVEESGTPTVVFINRIDEARGRVRDIVAALQGYASHLVVLRQIPIREGSQIVGAVDLVSERAWRYREGQPSALVELPSDLTSREHEARAELLEHISEFDDWLLEEVVEDREPPSDALYAICARVFGETRVLPALIGAGGHRNGLARLMKALRHEAPSVAALRARLSPAAVAQPLAAVCFHAQHKRHVGRTAFVRALGEGVGPGETLAGASVGLLSEIGSDKRLGAPLAPGEVAMVVKADQISAGALMTRDQALPPPRWARTAPPMVARLLLPRNDRDDVKLSAALARLGVDDPGLVVTQEESTGRQLVRIQGPMHLRRLAETLREEFGLEVSEEPLVGVYRETISRPANVHYRHRKQTGGAGQFADVKLTVQPAPRGSGFTFNETVKGGTVPRNYIPAVEAGAREAMQRGPLGFPVIDVSVTLTDGQHHSVDSSDHAFRTAARMGVLQALSEAGPLLLQEIYDVTIHAPSTCSGTLVGLVSSEKGQVLGVGNDPDACGWDVFRARLPGAALDELPQVLRSATQGVGNFEAAFDHFEELYGKEAEQIFERQRAAHG
ncbi:elongation factor G [Acuticoccus sediminis]|uniref:Elongation factor G n=1 Tax=Acuticoccus sediminis TaxID=2184697 RepID=A0A8B2NSI2_9HYPH|nr:elongation factor G [Acuticoccus sediminis]RAI01881.1 elongation factor G [Acuticoccus sediminis]